MSEEVLENVFLGVKDDQILVSSMNEDNRRINENTLKNTFFQDGEFYNINKMVLIHNPWTYNFQHFIDETLPICIECKDDPEVYVSVWPKFGDDIINFLQINNIKKIKNNTCFYVKRLIRKKLKYIDFKMNEKCNVNKPLSYVRGNVQTFLNKKNPKTLFIKRDVEKRQCKNINQLTSALQLKYDADVIENFSDLTVREKIIILNYYDNIISMYGATSANVLFKQTGAWLILSHPCGGDTKFISNLNTDLNIQPIDDISEYLDQNSITNHGEGVSEDTEFIINVNKCLEKIDQALNQSEEKLSTK